MRVVALAAVLGSAIIAAGCGGASAGVSPSESTTPAERTIVMGDFSYTPASVKVRVGQPVTFVNRGNIDHTVADTDAAGEIRSALITPRPIAPQESQVVVFDAPGTINYICTYHPTLMTGTITVSK